MSDKPNLTNVTLDPNTTEIVGMLDRQIGKTNKDWLVTFSKGAAITFGAVTGACVLAGLTVSPFVVIALAATCINMAVMHQQEKVEQVDFLSKVRAKLTFSP